MKNAIKKMVMLTAFVLSATYAMSVVDGGATAETTFMGCDSGKNDQQVTGQVIPCTTVDGQPGVQCCFSCDNSNLPKCQSGFNICAPLGQ